jgi:hypothetical protein
MHYTGIIQEKYGFIINSSNEAAFYNVINDILISTNNWLSKGRIFFNLKKLFVLNMQL